MIMPKKIRIPLPIQVEKVHKDKSMYTRKAKHPATMVAPEQDNIPHSQKKSR